MMLLKELQQELYNNVFTEFKGRACETWHFELTRKTREYLQSHYGEKYATQLDNTRAHGFYVTYKNCVLFWVDIKRKKFTEYRASYQAQYCYNDFIFSDSDSDLQTVIDAINKHLADIASIKQEQDERSRRILLDIMQAYNMTSAEARSACRAASNFMGV